MRRVGLAALALLLMAALSTQAGDTKRANCSVYRKTLRATALVISETGQGAGWIVNHEKKQLITSQHIVGKDENVLVVFPAYKNGRVIARRNYYRTGGRRTTGRVIYSDVRRDLALVVLDSLPDGVTELELAENSPEPGDTVHAIGCPGQSIGMWVYGHGYVRTVAEIDLAGELLATRPTSVIETQLPLNAGDSGGPLVNYKGQLVGVNTGKALLADLMSISMDVSEVKQFLAADTFYRQALPCVERKEWKKASQLLREVVKRDGEHLKALVLLARTQNELGAHDDAILLSLVALLLDEENADALRECGYAHLKKKRYDPAVKALKLAVEHNPKDIAAWRHLASAYDGVDEPELARQAREKADQLAEDQNP
jgi:hypothetical protein